MQHAHANAHAHVHVTCLSHVNAHVTCACACQCTTQRSTWPTLTLWSSFFERGGISASFCLLAGIALQDDLLGTLSLSPIFLLAQILMRTALGDENQIVRGGYTGKIR